MKSISRFLLNGTAIYLTLIPFFQPVFAQSNTDESLWSYDESLISSDGSSMTGISAEASILLFIAVFIIYPLVCGLICKNIAENKKRNTTTAFIVGLFLGIIGVFIYIFMGTIEVVKVKNSSNAKEIDSKNEVKTDNIYCKSCGKKIDGDSIFCTFCGIRQ